MRLCRPIFGLGYNVFFDNFYTGVQLLKDLFQEKTYCCGTLIVNRKGVPPNLKDSKLFGKGERGAMRL